MYENCIYILTNKSKKSVYVGVTSNLPKRIRQHKTKQYKGFTARYKIDRLVYYECFNSIIEAIQREKQIKGYRREKKDTLVNKMNPEWNELKITKTKRTPSTIQKSYPKSK